MSILGDLAVRAEMQLLLEYLETLKSLPPDQRLDRLCERIKTVMKDASEGRSRMLANLDAAAERQQKLRSSK